MRTGAPDYTKRILLYGLYDGVATPLACDEQGRLIFIPEEVSPFSKSGTVLVRDTFEDGLLHTVPSGTGTGYSVTLEPDESVVGGYSCKLTGGSTIDRIARILYYFHPSVFNKMGVEFSVRWGADVESLTLQIVVYDGEYYYDARLQYSPVDDDWKVYDWSDPGWTPVLSAVGYSEVAHYFYTFKLTIDFETGTYVRLHHTGAILGLSAYSIRKLANTGFPRVLAYLTVTSTDGNNGIVYLDNIIFTQDES